MINTFQKELYSDLVRKIKCGVYQGKMVLAKPVLVYSVINMIENGVVFNNRIPFSVDVEKGYKATFNCFGANITPFFKPFYYLQYDGFWHLEWMAGAKDTKKPSAKLIRDNVKYAYFDNALWDLLQDQEMRDYFRNIVLDHYLKEK